MNFMEEEFCIHRKTRKPIDKGTDHKKILITLYLSTRVKISTPLFTFGSIDMITFNFYYWEREKPIIILLLVNYIGKKKKINVTTQSL